MTGDLARRQDGGSSPLPSLLQRTLPPVPLHPPSLYARFKPTVALLPGVGMSC